MTEEQTKIDAMLAAGTSRLLNAAVAVNTLRTAMHDGDVPSAVRASDALSEHIDVFNHCLEEIARLVRIHSAAMMAVHGMPVQRDGGLIH